MIEQSFIGVPKMNFESNCAQICREFRSFIIRDEVTSESLLTDSNAFERDASAKRVKKVSGAKNFPRRKFGDFGAQVLTLRVQSFARARAGANAWVNLWESSESSILRGFPRGR